MIKNVSNDERAILGLMAQGIKDEVIASRRDSPSARIGGA